MTLVLRYAARSDVGRVRSKNDDSAYVGRHLAVLADGMGGHVGGDVASASTVLDLAPLDDVGYADPATVLPDEIQNANLILNELVHANPKLAGMGTTCTAALLAGETLHMAHIGDSRAYRLADGAFSRVTRDHTFVQKLVDEGRLEPAEAAFHPNRNVLMRVLGDVDASPELDVFEVPVSAGERWLFCSDGLTDVVPEERIHAELEGAETLQAAVDVLVELTLAGGAPDNVTILAFDVAEASEEELAPPPEVHLTEEALALAADPESGPVSGVLLREDLAVRPHVLVGAASHAVETDRIPVVTRSSTRRRAAALMGRTPSPENRPRRTAAILTFGDAPMTPAPMAPAVAVPHPTLVVDGTVAEAPAVPTTSSPTGAHDAGDERRAPAAPGPAGTTAPAVPDTPAEAASPETSTAAPALPAPATDARETTAPSAEEDARPPAPDRRSWFIPVFTGLLALLLLGAAVWGYAWSQSQYYVGEEGGRVAVYRGVPQRLGPLALSHVDHGTDVDVARLPAYAQDRVRSGMAARDLGHADQIVAELRSGAANGGTP